MFHMNPWKNMKRLFNYVIWSYISCFQHLFQHVLTTTQSCKSSIENNQPVIELLPTRSSWNNSFVEVTHNFTDVLFVSDQCNKGKAAYAAISGRENGKVLVSPDLIRKKFKVLRVESQMVQGRPVLTSLVFVKDGLLAVINNELILFDISTFEGIKIQEISKEEGVDKVNAHACCLDHQLWCRTLYKVVIAYKQTSPMKLYVSADGGNTFAMRNISYHVDSGHFRVISSTIIGGDLTAVFLVEDSASSHLNLLCIPLNSSHYIRVYANSYYTLPVPELNYTTGGRHVGMSQLRSNYYSLLLWNINRIIYKPRLDLKGIEVTVRRPLDEVRLESSEYIRHIHSNSLGEFIVITSQNRLLYGRESFRAETTFLDNFSSSMKESVVAIFGDVGYLMLIGPELNVGTYENSAPHVVTVYLPDELEKLKEHLPHCPYEYIQIYGLRSYYTLDINDKIQFSAEVHASAWHDMSLLTELSRSRSLVLHSFLTYKSNEPGVIDINMTTSAHIASVDYSGHINTAHALLPGTPTDTGLRVVPSATSVSCADNPQTVTHVTLGCDKDKRLVVNRAKRSCDTLMHQYIYQLQADEYDPDLGKYGYKVAEEPLDVKYNYSAYGCTNRTYYNTPFLFDLHLYRGTKYLGPMTGDYVIYEINGATKFQYSLTVNTSGCLFPPQSWREMRLAAVDGATSQNIWHRENYRSCNLSYDHLPRQTRLHTPHPDDAYEILSYDNGNYITFNRNGIFMFEIIVVDHDYSYCDLRAQLAVEVYGVVPEVPIDFFIIMSVTVMTGILIVVGIFCAVDYNRKRKISQEQEMTDIELFEDLITAHTSEQEKRATGLLITASTALSRATRSLSKRKKTVNRGRVSSTSRGQHRSRSQVSKDGSILQRSDRFSSRDHSLKYPFG